MRKQVADELQCRQMFSNAHWPQQRAWQLYITFNQQLSATVQQRYPILIITNYFKSQKQTEKLQKLPTAYRGLLADTLMKKQNKEVIHPRSKSLVRPYLEYAAQQR